VKDKFNEPIVKDNLKNLFALNSCLSNQITIFAELNGNISDEMVTFLVD